MYHSLFSAFLWQWIHYCICSIIDPDEIPGYWYNLVGVVVHTGTAEGGHYYSFIRDRTTKENSWYLFNDAEVKNFDPAQIAAECFGGEMTVSDR